MLNRIINKLYRHLNPKEYWKRQGLVVGEKTEIYPSASFGSEPYLVRLGNHVRINEGVTFVTHDGGAWVLRGLKTEYKDADIFKGRTVVEDNVHIGTNTIVMPGVTIGTNSIIGCGAVITKDIPPNSVAVGIPARVIESIEEYEKKNKGCIVQTKGLDWKSKKNYLSRLLN